MRIEDTQAGIVERLKSERDGFEIKRLSAIHELIGAEKAIGAARARLASYKSEPEFSELMRYVDDCRNAARLAKDAETVLAYERMK
jgi:hypothetical protein